MKRSITTIKLGRNTVGLLLKSKIHPRQPYEEVILALISGWKKHGKNIEIFGVQAKAKPGFITTIKISKKTVEVLNRLKIHPRQSFDEIVLRLILENEKNRKRFR